MKIGALTLFAPRHCNHVRTPGAWTIAALHWDWSLTWSFVFVYDVRCDGKLGPHFIRTNGGCIAALNMGRLGSFFFQKQATMPKRPASTVRDEP